MLRGPITRRYFVSCLGGSAAWPLAARAQQPERMRRIGVFMPGMADDPEGQARNAAFLQRLGELRWIVGRNVRSEYRWGPASHHQAGAAHAALAHQLRGFRMRASLRSLWLAALMASRKSKGRRGTSGRKASRGQQARQERRVRRGTRGRPARRSGSCLHNHQSLRVSLTRS